MNITEEEAQELLKSHTISKDGQFRDNPIVPVEVTRHSEVISGQWYEQLVDDCKTIVVETEFTSRWALVEGYHMLGSRILVEYENFQRLRMPDGELVQRLAISIGRSDRTVYYAIQFARMFPDLNLLKEGKNISWSHIVNKYLTDGEKRVTITKGDVIKMIKEIKELLQKEWMKENQTVVDESGSWWYDVCEFIRYLQDQVEKITGGLSQ